MPQALSREQLATLNNSSNDSGDLSLSCSFSSVIREESEVEGDLETVEAHQFEPVVAIVILQQSQIAEADDDVSCRCQCGNCVIMPCTKDCCPIAVRNLLMFAH